LNLSETTTEEIENIHNIISNNVKKYRLEANFTQMELSLLMGYKNSAFIGACENNANNKHFNVEQLYKISKILNIPLSKLVEIN